MKRIAFILSFVFVAGMGMSATAANVIADNGLQITIVDNDKKPCAAGCTCADCKAKSADSKAAGDAAKKADCSAKSADCSKKCDGKSTDAKKEGTAKPAAPAAEPAKK